MQLESCTKSATSKYFLVFIWSRFGFYFIGNSCSSSSSLILCYSNVILVISSCINSTLFINKMCSSNPKIYILHKCLILDQHCGIRAIVILRGQWVEWAWIPWKCLNTLRSVRWVNPKHHEWTQTPFKTI